MSEWSRLYTVYGIQLDPSTATLLKYVLPHDGFAASRKVSLSKWGGHDFLQYTLNFSDENEYQHKAVRRWLRDQIKRAKEASK